jgi:hypothetical protein
MTLGCSPYVCVCVCVTTCVCVAVVNRGGNCSLEPLLHQQSTVTYAVAYAVTYASHHFISMGDSAYSND